MYEAFYGLAERPFDLTSNPRYLFLTNTHREALGNLTYGITAQKGIVLLLGEAGTGKTTIIRAAMERQRGPEAVLVHLSNPTLSREEFYEFIAGGFGLPPSASLSKVRLLAQLNTSVTQHLAAGGLAALIVDEAQSLPHELLEEIRLLSNLETPGGKLLPVILAGQPELAERLNDTSLRQFKQRIALRCQLRALDLREAAAYIAKRIRVAGGDSVTIFTREAVVEVWRHSRGIPRIISVICDNALVNGFAVDRRPVGADIVLEVCRDFDLIGEDVAPVMAEDRQDEPQIRPAETPPPPAHPKAHVIPHPRALQTGSLFGLSQPDPPEAQAVNAPPRRKRFLFF
jgi:type II secretory pathway predicted ATPase ExeA